MVVENNLHFELFLLCGAQLTIHIAHLLGCGCLRRGFLRRRSLVLVSIVTVERAKVLSVIARLLQALLVW